MRIPIALALACAALSSACTTLGPMPAVSGANPIPAEHFDGELQAGAVPGFYLSSTVRENSEGTPIKQLAAMIEPNDAIDLPGLSVGARGVVGESDGYIEPMIRYRRFIDDDQQFALSGVGHATHASASERDASYSATRAGAEVTGDVRLTPISKWFELHAFGTLALMGLFADGDYCIDANGKYGIDCPEPGDPPGQRVHAEVSSFFPAASGGLALDIAHHLDSFFHGGRVALMAGGGTMPHVVGGEPSGTKFYGAFGLTATVGFGGAAQ